jgi:aminoglycoside phosphotransferase (APT) family kinase protein
MPETIPVRPGEEIDTARLAGYLRGRLDNAYGEIEVEQFAGGSSNLTYLVRIDGNEYVLRRPPFGNTVKTAHDMRREFDVLSKLSKVYASAPKPILFCDDGSVIDSEFYLMERRHGAIIRGNAGPLATSLRESSQVVRTDICKAFITNLAELHSLDFSAAGLAELGRPEGYNRRQVEGWTKRYVDAKTHDHADLERAIAWLSANIPPESAAALIHNDYKFDNIMLDPDDLTRITAVLDWEMVTVGDPLMDLGTTLGYWMSGDAGNGMLNMPFNPRVLMEKISRRELVEMYADASGRDVSNILFYYVFGTFKIAVIAQQIYARYVKGFTRDARIAGFDKFVEALGRIAARALATCTI